MLTEFGNSWGSPELGIKKEGIVLLVTHKGKILVVEETSDKTSTGRRKGDIGVICETKELDDTSNENVLLRGISQELGVRIEEIPYFFKRSSQCYRGSGPFIKGSSWAHVFTLECNRPEELINRMNEKGDGEVKFVGWWTLDQLKNPQNGENIRVGVSNIIKFIPNLVNI